ncbi:hypothetical protein TNCV_2313951 [Trichonephila clavipes]|nr:hypothetical protein TNCV_2313951 [Trichonephila clavipes]
MTREASLHPISGKKMWSDCEIFMLRSRKLLINRANRSEKFHDLGDFWLHGSELSVRSLIGSWQWEKGLVGVCSEYPGRNSKRAGREKRGTYIDCVSSLQPSIWFCDVHGVAALVGRGGRDFRSGYPMGAKETSAMEVGFDWRLEVSF